MVKNLIFDNLKFDEYVDWYIDIGYKIYIMKSFGYKVILFK